MASDIALLVFGAVGNVILRWGIIRGSWWLTTRFGHLLMGSGATGTGDWRSEAYARISRGEPASVTRAETRASLVIDDLWGTSVAGLGRSCAPGGAGAAQRTTPCLRRTDLR